MKKNKIAIKGGSPRHLLGDYLRGQTHSAKRIKNLIILLTGVSLLSFFTFTYLSQNSNFKQTKDGNYSYFDKNSKFDNITFSKKLPSVNIKSGDSSIGFAFQTSLAVNGPRVTGNKIVYENVATNTNLIYTIKDSNTIKEDIELTKAPILSSTVNGSQLTGSELSYTFEITLKNLTYQKQSDNSISPVFTNTKTGETFTIPPLVMTDAKGESSTDLNMYIFEVDSSTSRQNDERDTSVIPASEPESPGESGGILKQVQDDNGEVQDDKIVTLRAILTPNKEWLMSENRTYPVLIDPSITKGDPPIAYWKFDEEQGTSVNDSSGSGNIGTLGLGTSAPSWQSEDMCVSGKCLKFDGSDDYITLPTMTFGGPTTIEAWVNIKSYSSWARIIDISNGQASDQIMLVQYSTSGKISLQSYIGSTPSSITTDEAIPLNQWVHVIGVIDGSNSAIYWNGILKKTGTLSDPTVMTRTLNYIGKYNWSTATYPQAFYDELKIYNYARTVDQIRADYINRGGLYGVQAQFGYPTNKSGTNLSQGLVGYWKMDEASWNNNCSTDSVFDSSGSSLNGDACPNTTGPTGGAVGKFGNSGSFDGLNDYVNLGTSSTLGPTSLTVSTWFKQSGEIADTYYGALVSRVDGIGYHDNYNLFVSKTTNLLNARFGFGGTTLYQLSGTTNVYDGKWHHAVTTANYDGTNTKMILYLDGKVEAQGTQVGAIYTTSLTTYISRFSSQYFPGNIDEVRIYNRALSEREVRDLYNWAPGPVAYWDFNENTGTVANDKSGNGYTGTLTNGPTWNKGKFGSGVKFDGSDDFVSVSGLLGSPSEITISAWVNTSDSSGEIISLGDNVLLRIAGNTLYAFFYYDSLWEILSASSFSQGVWHYITYSYSDSGNIHSLYIDGILVDSATTSYSISYTLGANTVLGKHGNGTAGYEYSGLIDDVKVYNYVRTPAQIIEDMNAGHPAPGSPVGSALAYYKFDEGYGTTANNSGSGGSTLNGTITGATWTNEGKFGKALSFDGSGDYVSLGDSSSLQSTNISVSTWFNTSMTGTGMLLRKRTYGYLLSTTSGVISFSIYNSSATLYSASSTSTYNDGAWHHAVGVYDGAYVYLYIDGRLVNKTAAGTIYYGADDITVGRDGSSATPYYFTGKIDEVKIYNFALTLDQVKAEYNQGKAQVMGSIGTESDGTTPSFSSSREYCVPGDTATCNPPVAEWKFDEGTGTTTVYDTSGNGYNGTMNGSMTQSDWVRGKVGGALDFDGNDDYVDMGDVGDIAGSPLTVSAWIYNNSVASYFPYVSKYNYDTDTAANRSVSYALGLSTGKIFFDIFDSSQYQSGSSGRIGRWFNGTALSTGQWYHIVGTYDGGSSSTGIHIYVNGLMVDDADHNAGTFTAAEDVSAPLRVGAWAESTDLSLSQFFNGRIDQVRIYNYVRTPAQIAWEYNQGAPIVWYKMDECQGTTIYNSALNGNGDAAGNNGMLTIGASGTNTTPGTCAASGAWNAGATGKINSTMSFDNTDDYISIADDSTKLRPKNVSIGAWFKLAGSPSYETVVSKPYTSAPWSSPYISWLLRINSSTSIEMDVGNGSNYSAATFTVPTLSTGVWYHALFTYNGTTLTAYLNGNKIGTNTTVSGDIGYAAQPIIIGADHGASPYGDYFNGQIDDVRIYNYALTGAQVRDVYNNGAVGFK